MKFIDKSVGLTKYIKHKDSFGNVYDDNLKAIKGSFSVITTNLRACLRFICEKPKDGAKILL